jgi:hypothetical protein
VSAASLGRWPAVTDNSAMIRSVKRIPKQQQAAADLAFRLSRPMAERIASLGANRLSRRVCN